jgi:hypothetical protein
VGNCKVSRTQACESYACDPTAGACFTSCATSKDCTPPYLCTTAGQCVILGGA